ncbi:Acyl-CoA synthetase (AMP-forming)/AMP-acid ligase II [Formivibrio citricus]|uniref:Acyl-CoA synthetase (AMP-forming)/AMP-acid ligase II n=1 Tax=Formivibrio citricus TaxID=83765 RepID=A0A1I5C249_9NEIS|nr:AMP-binding protein [Formivibrio citricus]SFN80922.1 Acyl-CoA synthetase (AMP-forming)/AMP-acid ligase II [Formivibrio citricus]
MNLVSLLDEAAQRTPDAAAIIDGRLGAEHITSFADLCGHSAQIATLFAQAGIGRGDGVVILIPMSAELYAVIAAALRLGAVPVFIDPEQAAAQLERCRGVLPLKALVGTPKACLFRWLQPTLRTIKTVFVAQGWFPGAISLEHAGSLPPIAHAESGLEDEPAMLTFTSGSTGAPKGLLRSHRLLLETQQILIRHLALRPGNINLATMPALVMANLAHGVTSLIPEGDLRHPAALDPAHIASVIRHWKAESLLASPALVERLAEHCLSGHQTLDSLQVIFMGGAPVFLPVMQKAAQIAPQARVAALYGSTEAEPIALIHLDEICETDRRAIAQGAGLPAGQPLQEIGLAILQDRWGQPLGPFSETDMATLVLPAGKIGEVVVSGPHVSQGYLGGLGDMETKFRIGNKIWHRTGDSGWLDEAGRLWLTGRCSARLGEGEQTLYPLSVEAALANDPDIARAAFVSHRGKRLLVLELKQGVEPGPLEKTLSWAGIDRIVILSRIPVDRRHNAKTDYPALRRELDLLAGP